MIEATDLHKSFYEGERELPVLRGVSLQAAPQEKVGIVGDSGQGKSTLLHILGGLERPTRGQVRADSKDLYALSEEARCVLRNRFFGFVFQFYHLLPELTVLENVALPALIAGRPKGEAMGAAHAALQRVGLVAKAKAWPPYLSGGEQQRTAIARALILKPKVILADEPTGNLDQATGEEVLAYLQEAAADSGGALLLVTHNTALVRSMDKVYRLHDGKLHAH